LREKNSIYKMYDEIHVDKKIYSSMEA